MTRLTDDGFLETDSPIVASFFINEWGTTQSGMPIILRFVGPTGEGYRDDEGLFSYPIRFPASVVAKAVCQKWYPGGYKNGIVHFLYSELALNIIATLLNEPIENTNCIRPFDGAQQLWQWLRKHTTEEG